MIEHFRLCSNSYAYSYYNSDGSCQLCPAACATCTSPDNCLSCTSNSNASYAGQCVPCDNVLAGCSTCSSPLNCLTCQPGHSLIDGSCFEDYDGLSGGSIALIILGSLFLAGLVGYAIYAFWNRRRGFMGPEASA